MGRMAVNPPGMKFHHIVPHDGDMDGQTEGNEDGKSLDPPIWAEIMRFFTNPRKPMILALARPDPKKNLTTLVKAFGECRPLQELANLTSIMGNRDDVDEMSSTNASVLLSILKLINNNDLYGQVASPKHHKRSNVPDIYHLAAKIKATFINSTNDLSSTEQAAAHSLPIVATKNGGPVDIHRVLDNGLLVDPRNQQSIADALLKLVADKQLWAKCRANGLKNIHLFSWPEHCKTYLTKVASCKPRQPRWLRNDDDDDENSESDSSSDSLRDIQDISLNLKFSLDGDKNVSKENAHTSLDPDDRKSKLENAVLSWSKGVQTSTQKSGYADKGNQISAKFPARRRRKCIFVIAVDCSASTGLSESVKRIFDALEREKTEGSIGFILATSFNMSELHSFLVSEGLNPTYFDAFICNSGGDLYYSSLQSDDSHLIVDLYYHSHIEYCWGREGLRKTLAHWAATIIDKKGDDEEHIVVEDEKNSADYCYSFKVRRPGMVPPVRELRKLMRIRAFRCHVIFCQNGSKIIVIPVLASSCQALRYLYLRWGVDLSKVVVFVGESGDIDYEGLLGGVHESVILKGVCSEASSQLHANGSYPLTDVAFDSPNVVYTPEDCSSAELRDSLEKLGVLRS